MVQMDDTNPCVSSQAHRSPGAAVLSPASRAEWESWLRQGCPGMGHREEEHDGKASVPLHLWVLNCRPGLLRSKAAHILEQMASLCTISIGGLAHICTDAERGRRQRAEALSTQSRCGRKRAYLPWLTRVGTGLSRRWERLKYILMLSLGNQWFLHIPQV